MEEALRVAADEKAAARLLDAYVVQTRAGWGPPAIIAGCCLIAFRGNFTPLAGFTWVGGCGDVALASGPRSPIRGQKLTVATTVSLYDPAGTS